MAEIRALPSERIDAAAARQLSAALTDLIADGIDPGPRGEQIRSLGRSLETLAVDLRARVASLGLLQEVSGLDAAIEKIATFGRLARDYRAGSSGTEQP